MSEREQLERAVKMMRLWPDDADDVPQAFIDIAARWKAVFAALAAPVQPTEPAVRIAELEKALLDAAEDIESWAAYAGDYFQDKHDLAGCVAKYRATAAHPPLQPTEPDHFAWWAKDNIPEGTDVAVVMLCRRAWRAASAPVQPTEPLELSALRAQNRKLRELLLEKESDTSSGWARVIEVTDENTRLRLQIDSRQRQLEIIAMERADLEAQIAELRK